MSTHEMVWPMSSNAMIAALEAAGLTASTGDYCWTVACCSRIGGPHLAVHCAQREARYQGLTVLGPGAMDPRYRGRGWRERFAADCAEWLRREK